MDIETSEQLAFIPEQVESILMAVVDGVLRTEVYLEEKVGTGHLLCVCLCARLAPETLCFVLAPDRIATCLCDLHLEHASRSSTCSVQPSETRVDSTIKRVQDKVGSVFRKNGRQVTAEQRCTFRLC